MGQYNYAKSRSLAPPASIGSSHAEQVALLWYALSAWPRAMQINYKFIIYYCYSVY